MTKRTIDLEKFDIGALLDAMAAGQFSALDLTRHCLERIAACDDGLNAVIEINPDALEIAAQCDAARARGDALGALHGIPILIKDNIDTADGMMTTVGSLALVGAPALKDACVVQRLRACGAVILGKTNLSEWANMRSTRSTSGWSSRGGQTCNAYDRTRSPDGSSSGSAVAVAAAYCAAAIGTETDGSIVSPASSNGIVGIKPTVGLVGRSGIAPIAHSQDTAGPMARSVADAARLLGAIAGQDVDDAACDEADTHRAPDYTVFLDDDALRGARIGVAAQFVSGNASMADMFEHSIAIMRAAGAVIVDGIELPTIDDISPHEDVVLMSEFKVDLAAYLARRGPDVAVHTLGELIEYNRVHAQTVMPHFAQDVFEAAEATNGLDDPAYHAARAACLRLSRDQGIDAAMTRHNLDAIVATTAGVACPLDWSKGDTWQGATSYLSAVSGYPAMTVPQGYLDGLPVGLSFMAGAWAEPKLIALAHGFETHAQARRPPT